MWSRSPSFVLSTLQGAAVDEPDRAPEDSKNDGRSVNGGQYSTDGTIRQRITSTGALRRAASDATASDDAFRGRSTADNTGGFQRESTGATLASRDVSIRLTDTYPPEATASFSMARDTHGESVGPFSDIEMTNGDNFIVDDAAETLGRTRITPPVAFSTLLFFRTAFIVLAFPFGLLYELFAVVRMRRCKDCRPLVLNASMNRTPRESRTSAGSLRGTPSTQTIANSAKRVADLCHSCLMRTGFRAYFEEWRLIAVYSVSVGSVVLYAMDQSHQFPRGRLMYVFSPLVFFFVMLVARCLTVAMRTDHKLHIEGARSARLRRRIAALSERFPWLKDVPLPCEPSVRDELGRISSLVQLLRTRKSSSAARPTRPVTPASQTAVDATDQVTESPPSLPPRDPQPQLDPSINGTLSGATPVTLASSALVTNDNGVLSTAPSVRQNTAQLAVGADDDPARMSSAARGSFHDRRSIAGLRHEEYVLSIEQIELTGADDLQPGFTTTESWVRQAQKSGGERRPAPMQTPLSNERAPIDKNAAAGRVAAVAADGGVALDADAAERAAAGGSSEDAPVVVGWDMACIALGIAWHCRMDPPEKGHPDFRLVSRVVTFLCGLLFAAAPVVYEASVGTGTGRAAINHASYTSVYIMTTFIVLAFYLVCEVGWSIDLAIRYFYQRNLQHHLLTSLAVRRGGISLLSTPTLEDRHPAPDYADARDMAPVMMFRMTDANDLFAWFRIRRVLLAWDMVENGHVADASFSLAFIAGTVLTAVGVYVITTLLFGIKSLSPGPTIPFMFVAFAIGTIGMSPIALMGAQTNRSQMLHTELLREVRVHLLWRRQLKKQRHGIAMEAEDDEESYADLRDGMSPRESEAEEEGEIETLLGELADFVSNEAQATRIMGIPITIEIASSIGGTLVAALAATGASF